MLANGLFLSKLLYLLPMWGGLPQRDAKNTPNFNEQVCQDGAGMWQKNKDEDAHAWV